MKRTEIIDEQSKARLARRAYHRQWEQANQDKRRQYTQRYWARRYDAEHAESAEK